MGAQTSSPFIIVGLGNPGPKYALTRHNLGFLVVDLLASRWKDPTFKDKFHGQLAETSFEATRVLLLKPQTYMNHSGLSVQETVQFYKADPASHIIVISDDLDLPVGALRIRLKGGAGGHNGLKSIAESLGTDDFPRLRIGIGRSATIAGEEYVLGKIPKAEEGLYQDALNAAATAVETVLKDGILKAMNAFNKKTGEKEET